MAGQSDKKSQKKKNLNNSIWKIAIIIVTILYILINAYSVYFHDYEYTKGDTIGFLFLTIVNFLMYRLLESFMDSFLYLPMIDILVINLSVELLINFHWKFWFLYLVVPGYFLYKGALMVYAHVKTVGKADEGEEPVDPRSGKGKSNSGTQKTKIVKVKQ